MPDDVQDTGQDRLEGTLTPGLTLLLAVATGVAVANLYYAQPLLAALSRYFHAPEVSLGLVVTLTQLGYAAGLLLLVPLGDVLDRRRLSVSVLCVAVLALLGAACSPSLVVFAAVSVLIGLSSVAAQVLVPFAASLAAPERRGRAVGTVMSGLLLGILLARTLSGLIAGVGGWRTVYFVAAGAIALLAAVLARSLPRDTRRQGTLSGYPQLLASVWALFRREPLLRRRSLYGGLGFAAFSLFWTSVAFLLAAPPYRYPESVIGLFGLAGAAGAIAAGFAGRLADRGHARRSTLGFGALMLLAFALMGLYAHLLLPLLLGVVLLDLGVQGLHITNQSLVYTLPPGERSRVTTAYLFSYFLSGALGSAASALLFARFGWSGVMWAGAACGAGVLLVWLTDARRAAAAAA